MKRFFLSVSIIFLSFISLTLPAAAYAYVSGGTGNLSLSPSTGLLAVGQTTAIDILFSSGATAISSVSLRVTIPVVSSDIEVVDVTENTATGWMFPVKTAKVSGSAIQVDIMALNASLEGQAIQNPTKLGTIIVRPKKSFSAKQFQFDQTVSKMFRKADAVDMLGILGNGSYGTTGQAAAESTATPTPTQVSNAGASPTPTQAQFIVVNSPTPTSITGGFGSYLTSTPTPTRISGTIQGTATPIQTIGVGTTPIYTASEIPSVASTPAESPASQKLSIASFYSAKRETQPTFSVSGTAPAFSSIRISITPDGVQGTTEADASGSWKYTVTKALKTGDKQLTVTSTVGGVSTTKTESFKVAGKSSPLVTIVIALLILGCLTGGFFYWKKKREESTIMSSAGSGYQDPGSSPTLSPSVQSQSSDVSVPLSQDSSVQSTPESPASSPQDTSSQPPSTPQI